MFISTLRHASVFDPLEHGNKKYLVVGVGGIGSFLVEALVRLGVKYIEVFDDDIVEAHNIGNQNYSNSDIGKPKIKALSDYLSDRHGFNIGINEGYLDAESELPLDLDDEAILFLAVDTVTARQDIMTLVRDGYPEIKLVIDARMSVDRVVSYGLNPHEDEEYERWLASLPSEDAPVEMSACGGSISVISTVHMVVGQSLDWMIQHLNIDSPDTAVVHSNRGNFIRLIENGEDIIHPL